MTISYIYKLAAASSSRANLSLANNVMANRSYKIHVYSLVFDVDEFLFLAPPPFLLTFTSRRKIITFARYCFTFVLRRASKILQSIRETKHVFRVLFRRKEGKGGIAKSHEKNIAILKVKGLAFSTSKDFSLATSALSSRTIFATGSSLTIGRLTTLCALCANRNVRAVSL